MPLATFLSSKTTFPAVKTGSPLSRQDPFSHENFPHAGGRPGQPAAARAFPRVCHEVRDEADPGSSNLGLGLPLQLLPWPPSQELSPNPALDTRSLRVGQASEPNCLVLRSRKLPLSTSQEGACQRSDFRVNNRHLSLCPPSQTLEDVLSHSKRRTVVFLLCLETLA